MILFALIDCLFEFFDRFFGVGISIGDLSGSRVGERDLGVFARGYGRSPLPGCRSKHCVALYGLVNTHERCYFAPFC
jgi:hypothetical protein